MIYAGTGHMSHVPPDGRPDALYMVVGEAPAREEVRLGRGFVGPSGSLLWPLLSRHAGVTRDECYVTNLCKHPLDNSVSGDAKMTDEEFDACASELWDEVTAVKPTAILAVGALAAEALLGARYIGMEACNGVRFPIGNLGRGVCLVVPTWHPAAALRPGREKSLVYTAQAIRSWLTGPWHPKPPTVPPPLYSDPPRLGVVGIDTEGTVDEPLCVTLSDGLDRWFLTPEQARDWWSMSSCQLVYHNAVWDWKILEAIGIPAPYIRDFHDTMEKAYLQQLPSQGLKNLSYRFLGLHMKEYKDVVMPHYTREVRAAAAEVIMEDTVVMTHSAKTGRPLKKPKYIYGAKAKMLRRLRDPEMLAERLEFPPPSLLYVPRDEFVEYATLDAWATVNLWRRM